MTRRIGRGHFVWIIGVCLTVGCQKPQELPRTDTFLTVEPAVKISDRSFPGLVRNSRGVLTATAFLHSSFPSALEAHPAIQIIQSKDNGATWQALAALPSFVTYGPWGYDLAIDGGDRLYLTWIASIYADQTKAPFKAVMFARSDDGGVSWTNPVCVNTTHSGQRMNPQMTVGKESVVLAWLEPNEPTGGPRRRVGGVRQSVHFTCSRDRGATWSPSRCLENDLEKKDSSSSVPALYTSADDRVYCGYFAIHNDNNRATGEVWIARSDDQGRRFTSHRHNTGPLGTLSLVEASGTLYVAGVYVKGIKSISLAHPETTQEIRFYTVSEGGRKWSTPALIDDDENHRVKASLQLVGAGSNRLLACWHDGREGVYMAASRDGGKTWGKNLKVAPASQVGLTPLALAVDRASGAFYLLANDVHKGTGDAIYLVKGRMR